MLTRNARVALLVILAVIALIQGIAVIRNTSWPIEKWLGAW